MLIDGKKISEEIKATLNGESASRRIKLAIVQVGEDEASKKFIERKIKFAEEIGIKTRVYNLPADITTNKLRQKMAEISHILENDGVILQLPLPARNATHSVAGGPEQIKTQYVLNGIIVKKDVDVLSSRAFGDFATGHSKILPPVVEAVKTIFEAYSIDFKNKNIVIVGAGRLVGKPVAVWLINNNATFSVVDKFTKDLTSFTKKADIIISGVGKKNLITPDMIRDGVVIIDVGDAAPEVAEKASLFTPAIGGLGPLTVAMVFKNLIELNK